MKNTIKHIKYNRNGVGGEGFYSMVFFHEDNSGEICRLIAIVNETDIEEYNDSSYSRVYVISPDEMDCDWRGDTMGEYVINSVKDYCKEKYGN